MPDPREVFPILETSSGAGSVPREAVNTVTDPAGLLGLIAFSFINSSGNVVLPVLDSSGRLPVTSDASGTCLNAHGEFAAGSLTLVDVTGALITGALSKVYTKIGAQVSCLHASLFQIIHTDDAGVGDVETILDEIIVGPGQYSLFMELSCLEVDTTSGTLVQEFNIKAKNFVRLSSLRGTLSMLERN